MIALLVFIGLLVFIAATAAASFLVGGLYGMRAGRASAPPGCPPIALPGLVHQTIAGAPHPLLGVALADAIVRAATAAVQGLGHPGGEDTPGAADDVSRALEDLWDAPSFGETGWTPEDQEGEDS